MDFLEKIRKQRDQEQKLKWEGTFLDYLELIKQRPEVAQSAHTRVYNMIESAGISENDGHKTYQFFSKEIYGLEKLQNRRTKITERTKWKKLKNKAQSSEKDYQE